MNDSCYTWLLALLLCFGIGVRAGNVVSLSTASGPPGTEVTVSVGMANTDAITMLQLTVPLDENLSLVDNSLTTGSRLTGLSATAGVKDGALNIVIYSSDMTTISAGSGELLTFRLLTGDVPSDIALTPSNLVLTGSDGQAKEGSTEAGSVSIRCAKAQYSSTTVNFSRVAIRNSYSRSVTVNNVGNEPLTITGVEFDDATFSSTTSFPLTIAAGSGGYLNVTYAPTERGTVETQMKVVCNSISKLNTIQLKAQPYAVNELRVGNATGVSDETVTIPLTMNNMDGIIGFQLEFNMPEALEYVDGSFALSDRKDDHQATVTMQNGKLTIVAISSSGKAFKGEDGQLGSFDVKLVGRNTVYLNASKAILSAIIGGEVTDVLSAKYSGTITIKSPRISANSTLAFGDKPFTEDVEQTFSIYNNGNAPLTISRILFNDERFSVKESLPIIINQYGSSTVTVVNSDKTAGEFSGTMQIYSNDPDQRLWTVAVSGQVIAPNYLTFATQNVTSGEDVKLDVMMDNYNAISGIQFDITAPEEYTIDASKINLTERAEGLEVTVQKVDDTTWRIVGYIMGSGIASGEGKVMTISLTPVEELADGAYQLNVNGMVLGDKDLVNKYEGPTTHSLTFNVQSFVLGDANGDGRVNVNDVVMAVDRILQRNTEAFVFKAADVNGDNSINVNDVVGIVDIILGRFVPNNARIVTRGMATDDDSMRLTANSDGSVSLCLDNQNRYVAAQFDVRLAEGQELTGIRLNQERENGHRLTCSQVADNVYRVIIFSMGSQSFRGSEGELVNMRTSSDCSGMSIENLRLVTNERETKAFDSLHTVATGIRSDRQLPTGDIYTIDGRLARQKTATTNGLKKGIYIINNHRIIVK